jgi:hypothetical protein
MYTHTHTHTRAYLYNPKEEDIGSGFPRDGRSFHTKWNWNRSLGLSCEDDDNDKCCFKYDSY